MINFKNLFYRSHNPSHSPLFPHNKFWSQNLLNFFFLWATLANLGCRVLSKNAYIEFHIRLCIYRTCCYLGSRYVDFLSKILEAISINKRKLKNLRFCQKCQFFTQKGRLKDRLCSMPHAPHSRLKSDKSSI